MEIYELQSEKYAKNPQKNKTVEINFTCFLEKAWRFLSSKGQTFVSSKISLFFILIFWEKQQRKTIS